MPGEILFNSLQWCAPIVSSQGILNMPVMMHEINAKSAELLAKVSQEATLVEPVWPELSRANLIAMIAVNAGSVILAYVLLRIIWRPPTKEEIARDKEMHKKIEAVQEQYGAITAEDAIEGEVMGDYSEHWTNTFDLTLVIFMASALVGLSIWTTMSYPQLWSDYMFWVMQLPKLGLMMLVAIIGGLTCRYFCPTDEYGYITTSKHSIFKVNYTRKFQHFAAYMVPLVVKYKSSVTGPIIDAWGDWFTMLAFMLLIKPVRENFSFFMLQVRLHFITFI